MKPAPSPNHEQNDNRPRRELWFLLLTLLMSFSCVCASAELAIRFWPNRLTSTNLLAQHQADYRGRSDLARFGLLDPLIGVEAATDVARLQITPSDYQGDDPILVVVLPGTPTPTTKLDPSPAPPKINEASISPQATATNAPTGPVQANSAQQNITPILIAPTGTLPPTATLIPALLASPTPNIHPSPSPLPPSSTPEPSPTPEPPTPPPDDDDDDDDDNPPPTSTPPPPPTSTPMPTPTPTPPIFQISGLVFEDRNYSGGPGTAFGSGDAPLPNARVELYAASTLMAATMTDAAGSYTFNNVANGAYTLRVVSATIGDADTPPAAGFNSDFVSAVAEQTYERNGSNGNGNAGALGGNNPNASDLDTAAGAGLGDINIPVTVNNANVNGVDFGFTYNLVINTNDAGQGTLRQALANANAIAGVDAIIFNIIGVNPYTIRPLASLPVISDPIIIDGASQPGFGGLPLIELDGTLSGGLVITAGNSLVRGLVINRTEIGLDLRTNGNNLIQDNFIGSDVSGATAPGGMATGIRITRSQGNIIGGANPGQGNLISGHSDTGILIDDIPSVGWVTNGQQALYTFEAGSGSVITDMSGVGAPLDLTIEDPARVSWGLDSLSVNAATRISASGGANKIYNACVASNEISFEAWITPANDSQSGPAYILTSSLNPANHNFTLGQDGNSYIAYLRTTDNGAAGTNTILTTNVELAPTHIVFTRDATGTARLYLNSVLVDTDTISGDFSNWDPAFDFGLANEFNNSSTAEGHDWQGEYDLVSVYCQALSSAEVSQNYSALARNLIQDNLIGSDITGAAALGNGLGISIQNAINTTIGGTSAGEGNLIAYSTDTGIVIAGNGSGNNTITGNSIHTNGGLGIDLSNDGATLNDPSDNDSGPNTLRNFPVIYTATISNGNVFISGEAPPNTRVEFFIADPDPSGYGEGRTFLGAGVANGALPGAVDPAARQFSFVFPQGSLVAGDQMTATATDKAGNSSEFGLNVIVN